MRKGELFLLVPYVCSALASSGAPRAFGAASCFIHRARHGTLGRMRDHLENRFRRRQTDRHVRDAEVLVEASNDRRQNGNQEAEFHPRHSSAAKRRSNFDEKIGKGERKDQIGEMKPGTTWRNTQG